MSSAQLHGHDRPQPRHGRAMRHPGRGGRGRRLLAPKTEEMALFSERLDDEREYESTVSDFIRLHDIVHAADVYDS